LVLKRPWGPDLRELRDFLGERDERGDRERDAFDLGIEEGEPKRSEGPREQRVPLWINSLESDKGRSFRCGIKPLERRYQAGEV
jgi:hypothetical protein